MATATQRGYEHTIYRLGEGGSESLPEVGRFLVDPTNYNLRGEEPELIAEQFLTDFCKGNNLPAGDYRVRIVNLFEGNHILTIDRPIPLPESWAKLSTWHSEATGRPSKFYALTLLHAYPAADVGLIGEHLETFDDHYQGRISTAELAARTGYALPEGTPRPVDRRVELAPDKE